MKRSLEETARRFDEMAEDYDETSTEWLIRAQQVVLEVAHPKAGESAIDLGTGTGVLAKGLSPRLKEVIAIDISIRMLEKVDARNLPNVRTLMASFEDFESKISEKVDLVVSNFAMHHLDQKEKENAIKSITSVLAPKGRFVLGDLMIFEDTTLYDGLFDPEVDDPSPVSFLEETLRKLGFSVTTKKLHPIVGVILAER